MKRSLNRQESGFTILETLIALMLSSITLLFLNSLMLQLTKIHELVIADAQPLAMSRDRIRGSRQIEWHIFLNQLEKSLEDTNLINYTFDSFTITEGEDTGKYLPPIQYGRALSGSQNFYRSNNRGYNEMLTGIQDVYLEIDHQWLILDVRFQNDESYQGRIWVESWKEEN